MLQTTDVLSVPVKIEETPAKVLFDSGASINVLNIKFTLNKEIRNLERDIKLKGFTNDESRPSGTCKINIDLGSGCHETEVYVVEDIPFDLIIGHNTIKDWGVCIDYKTDKLSINGKDLKNNELSAFICVISETEDLKNRLKNRISDKLTKDQLEATLEILVSKKEAFSVNGELGRVTSKYCVIKLKPDALPIKSQPYRDVDGNKTEKRLVTHLRKHKMAVSDNYSVPFFDQTLEKIPRELMVVDELKKHLRELEKQLDNYEYKLSIPSYAGELYLKINLADCTFEDLARGRENVIPFESHDLDKCKIGDDFLCQIPRYGMKNSKKIICIKNLIAGASIEELQSVCPVLCHEDTAPSITTVAPREYILTNLGENSGFIKCDEIVLPLAGPKIGAVSAKIPCDCCLITDSVRKNSDAFPCVAPEITSVSWNHTLPATFKTQYPTIKVANQYFCQSIMILKV
ncbi:unnamed protein product [Orchesella dallaii]|uniref:Peptidase A2 domain-containing protein n=1 Tax=Orchesella dallaii TaxID=48710 RepID=A0ABP1PYS8_9HEXA